jgi:hypothetical protein
LVVAMLALLACEGDSDPNVSAGHVGIPACRGRAWTKKNPAQARGAASVARSRWAMPTRRDATVTRCGEGRHDRDGPARPSPSTKRRHIDGACGGGA